MQLSRGYIPLESNVNRLRYSTKLKDIYTEVTRRTVMLWIWSLPTGGFVPNLWYWSHPIYVQTDQVTLAGRSFFYYHLHYHHCSRDLGPSELIINENLKAGIVGSVAILSNHGPKKLTLHTLYVTTRWPGNCAAPQMFPTLLHRYNVHSFPPDFQREGSPISSENHNRTISCTCYGLQKSKENFATASCAPSTEPYDNIMDAMELDPHEDGAADNIKRFRPPRNCLTRNIQKTNNCSWIWSWKMS